MRKRGSILSSALKMKQKYKNPHRIMCFSTGSYKSSELLQVPECKLGSESWLGRLSDEGTTWPARSQAAALLLRGWDQ